MKNLILSQDTAATQDFYYFLEKQSYGGVMHLYELNSLNPQYDYLDGPGWYYLNEKGSYTQAGKYEFTGERRTLTIRIYINNVRTNVKQEFEVVRNITKDILFFANAENDWNVYPYTAVTTEDSIVDNTYSYTMDYYDVRKFTTGLTIAEPRPGVRYLPNQNLVQYNDRFPKIEYSSQELPGRADRKLEERPFSDYGLTMDLVMAYARSLFNGSHPISQMNVILNDQPASSGGIEDNIITIGAEMLYIKINSSTSMVEFWIAGQSPVS
jgi:hypothetical protein